MVYGFAPREPRSTMNHALRTVPTWLLAAALAWGCAPTRTDIRPTSVAAPEPSAPGGEPAAPVAQPAPPEAVEPPAPAPEASPDEPSPEQAERAALRERILEAARALLGSRRRLDCSGYVLAAYRAAGLEVALPAARTRSAALQAAGREVATPEPGDLAFFHDTYDRNRNGRPDDGITHVALVESVDGSTVTLLHRGRRRVERVRMDLERPWDRDLNDPVRVRRPRDARGTRYLAGELFTAFGALLDGTVTQSLQARPAEDTGGQHPASGWPREEARMSRSEPAPSRSTRRRAPPSSRAAACSGSCPPTRRSSSPSSVSAAPGAPSSPAP